MFGANGLTVFIPDIALSKPQKSYTGKKANDYRQHLELIWCSVMIACNPLAG